MSKIGDWLAARKRSSILLCMKTNTQVSAYVLGAILALGPGWAVSQSTSNPDQPGAKQDLHAAGHATKTAAKDTGHGVATGTKKAYHATAHGTKKVFHKTANTTKGAVDGAKQGAKKPQ